MKKATLLYKQKIVFIYEVSIFYSKTSKGRKLILTFTYKF